MRLKWKSLVEFSRKFHHWLTLRGPVSSRYGSQSRPPVIAQELIMFSCWLQENPNASFKRSRFRSTESIHIIELLIHRNLGSLLGQHTVKNSLQTRLKHGDLLEDLVKAGSGYTSNEHEDEEAQKTYMTVRTFIQRPKIYRRASVINVDPKTQKVSANALNSTLVLMHKGCLMRSWTSPQGRADRT